jgi:hypothetical protein
MNKIPDPIFSPDLLEVKEVKAAFGISCNL